MNHDVSDVAKSKLVYKVVLTGGPCGGKTTSLATVTSFFQSLGWKVFRIGEVAYTFLSGGLVFPDLPEESIYEFQKNLIFTMMQIEKTFEDLARADSNDKVLIVCDRGVMDSTAYMLEGQWQRACGEEGWSETELRDRRYNQVIHMVSVAKGKPDHYNTSDHTTRHESLEEAVQLDDKVASAWVGHPYYDVIDNSSNFDDKLKRMLQCICDRIGMSTADRLTLKARKLKFLVEEIDWQHESLTSVKVHESCVEHRFLSGSVSCSEHARLRCRRGADQDCTFVHTTRSLDRGSGQIVEKKRPLSRQTYGLLLRTQASTEHAALYKTRYSFLWHDQCYQLDVFDSKRCPANSLASSGLILLETFSAKEPNQLEVPPFLLGLRDVSGEASYRLFNLATLGESCHGCFAGEAAVAPECKE